ncbi:inositol 2-dehydrogenase [Vagococcus vulneris]|uniref:Inositol 2-dehydrogenase n=1 Tax=Vagococcus vulneris TaxID=1977869 RepID=A0A430A1N8_9ENTE|nr:inositol 2-dehydrogenase [Vagococcus vulneris]RSU00277.1 inositol 2-dehydrogenase [Vagococcus vulneris]
MTNINVGIIGLGRLGKAHAENLAFNVPNCNLYAACSVVEAELLYAKEHLKVKKTYSVYEEMLADNNVDAVFIVSPSGLHCSQIQSAMKAGKHVFSEKPLGLDTQEIEETIDVINQYPDQIFMLGFMRRYDESYKYAKQMVDNGELGELTVVRSYSIDPSEGMESFVKFAGASFSGGLFADMSIHDIDLLRWFTNQEVNKVWALGKNAAYKELDEVGELETGAVMLQMQDNTMGIFVAGRNAQHGYHVETELIGTKGMLRIAQVPEKNLVTVMNNEGVVRPTSRNFPERFSQAFTDEAKAFINAIVTGVQPEIKANDGLQATKIAIACQKSYENNELVDVR